MVPAVYKWGFLRHLPASAFAGGVLLCATCAASGEERSLTRAVYEFAVTSYCGTSTPEVEAGFHTEVAALTERGGFDAETARRLRIRGWVEAELEWRNRGLGGNRAWCESEGVAAARHFQAIARGQQQP
jgi:hypothetical protein